MLIIIFTFKLQLMTLYYHQFNIYNITERDSSEKFLPK